MQKRLTLCCLTQARFAEYRLFYRAVLQKRPIISRRHAIWIVSDRCAFGESMRAPCLVTTHTHMHTYTHAHIHTLMRVRNAKRHTEMWYGWYHIFVCTYLYALFGDHTHTHTHPHPHPHKHTLLNAKNVIRLTGMRYATQKCDVTHRNVSWLMWHIRMPCSVTTHTHTHTHRHTDRHKYIQTLMHVRNAICVISKNIVSFIGLFCKRDL